MNKKLAIQGHPFRGNEIIEILKMLGGRLVYLNDTFGTLNDRIYFIDKYNDISWDYIGPEEIKNYEIFTIEKFLEKYPYQVGDKILYDNKLCKITAMVWEYNSICYKLNDKIYTNELDKLKPYKEETIIDTIKESNDRYRIHVNYQFKIEVDEGEYYVVRKKSQYPKTYEECCRILNSNPHVKLVYNLSDAQTYSYDVDNLQIYENIRKLYICRNAYWKIIGEEMGIGRPWKPELDKLFNNIYASYDTLKNSFINPSHFVFPTPEIRDMFFMNFKDLIEKCK